MNCLVVGASGYIGSAVSRALEQEGNRVLRIGGASSLRGRADFAYYDGIYTAMQQELSGIEAVVYCAGRVVPTTNVSPNEAIKLDGFPLGEMLDSVACCGRQPVFVLISSAGAVYGPAPEGGVLIEHSVLAPMSVYGLVRSHMENLVGYARRARQVRGISLRLSNVYGPGQRVNGPAAFVVRALTAAKTGLPMELWGGGQQRKDFLFIEDVARAVNAALRYGVEDFDWAAPNHFNACRGSSISLIEMLALIKQVTGREVPFRAIEARASDVQRVELSAKLAAERLGWKAGVDIPEGLARFWAALNQA